MPDMAEPPRTPFLWPNRRYSIYKAKHVGFPPTATSLRVSQDSHGFLPSVCFGCEVLLKCLKTLDFRFCYHALFNVRGQALKFSDGRVWQLEADWKTWWLLGPNPSNLVPGWYPNGHSWWMLTQSPVISCSARRNFQIPSAERYGKMPHSFEPYKVAHGLSEYGVSISIYA